MGLNRFWNWLIPYEEAMQALVIASNDAHMATRAQIYELQKEIAQLSAKLDQKDPNPLKPTKAPEVIDWEEAERRNLAAMEELNGSQDKRR